MRICILENPFARIVLLLNYIKRLFLECLYLILVKEDVQVFELSRLGVGDSISNGWRVHYLINKYSWDIE
jgi:hypothetical protein